MSVNALIFTEMMGEDYGYMRALGAYRIATEIRKAGYTCQVIDFFTEFSSIEMEKIISSFIGENTLFVGFSSTFFEYTDVILDTFQVAFTRKEAQSPGSHVFTRSYPHHTMHMQKLFDKIKEINPRIKFVLGGSKTQYLEGICDAYAVGFCDQAIVEYMRYLEGKNPFFQFERLNDKQIAFYGDRYTGKFEFVKSTVVWHETDHLFHGEVVPIEIARGCIFRCAFCSYALNGKKKLDYIKEDNILRDEYLKNYYEHGITKYIYADDTHNDSVEKLERLHKIVTSLPFEIEYSAYLRHDLIYAHRETAVLLKESGLRSAAFGIETLNHESGKAIGKGLHPEKTKELLYWLKEDVWKDEVATSSGFIIGLPHDTPDTIREWTKWVLDPLCPIDQVYILPLFIANTASSGRIWKSEFELSAEKYGYIRGENNYWSNEYFTQYTANKLSEELNMILNKTDRVRCGGHPLLVYCNMGFSPKDLIGQKRSSLRKCMPLLKKQYIDRYKEKLLKQINNEISI